MKPISSLPEAFACLQSLQAFLESMTPKIKSVDRVLTLMRELNRPLSPTEIVAEWRARDWPPPRRGDDLYNLICGTLVQLRKKKRRIERTKRGLYVLPSTSPETINPSNP